MMKCSYLRDQWPKIAADGVRTAGRDAATREVEQGRTAATRGRGARAADGGGVRGGGSSRSGRVGSNWGRVR
jgi:hypothetical protein